MKICGKSDMNNIFSSLIPSPYQRISTVVLFLVSHLMNYTFYLMKILLDPPPINSHVGPAPTNSISVFGSIKSSDILEIWKAMFVLLSALSISSNSSRTFPLREDCIKVKLSGVFSRKRIPTAALLLPWYSSDLTQFRSVSRYKKM